MAEQQAYYEHTTSSGKVDKFKVVNSIDEVPMAWRVWNIGRRNFPLRSYIPMVRVNHDYSIDVRTLMAVPVENEERALYLMDLAHKQKFTAYDIKYGKV